MSLTIESGYTSTLSAKLTAAAVTMTVAVAPTVTAGRLYLKSGSTEEWISYTWVSSLTLTGLTRWLSQTADPATAWTWSDWVAWTIVTLVFMHDQTFDRQAPLPLTFATTAARDTALWADWAATSGWVNIEVTATGLKYMYNLATAQWESVDTWTATPNASDTVTGWTRLADSAQSIAWTDTESANPLVVIPSDIAANSQSWTFKYWADAGWDDTYVVALTPVLVAYTTWQRLSFNATTANTWACTVDFWPWVLNIKDRAWNDPVNGFIAASDTIEWYYDWTNFVIDSAPKLATAAEVVTWTAEDKVASVKDWNDSWLLVTDSITLTRDNTASTWAVQYSHTLWRIPKLITFHCIDATNEWSHWAYDWTTDNVTYATWTPWATTSNSISIRTHSGSGSAYQTWTVSAMTTTTFDITWTKTGSPTGTAGVHATLIG